jgi:hypothetical protein
VDSGDDKEITIIARKFRKFFRNNGNFRSKETKNSVNPSNEVKDNENQKDKLFRGHKCHECGGVGHICADCRNLINSKGKAFNVTQSDESNNEKKI